MNGAASASDVNNPTASDLNETLINTNLNKSLTGIIDGFVIPECSHK
jgi:hypothetical protein